MSKIVETLNQMKQIFLVPVSIFDMMEGEKRDMELLGGGFLSDVSALMGRMDRYIRV